MFHSLIQLISSLIKQHLLFEHEKHIKDKFFCYQISRWNTYFSIQYSVVCLSPSRDNSHAVELQSLVHHCMWGKKKINLCKVQCVLVCHIHIVRTKKGHTYSFAGYMQNGILDMVRKCFPVISEQVSHCDDARQPHWSAGLLLSA